MDQNPEKADDVAVFAAGHDLYLPDKVLLKLYVRRLLQQLHSYVHRLALNRQVHTWAGVGICAMMVDGVLVRNNLNNYNFQSNVRLHTALGKLKLQEV